MALMASGLAVQAMDVSRGFAVRQLRQIVVRQVKGAVAMRLEVWRMSTRMAAYARHRELQAALEARLLDESKSVALRQLRQFAVRLMRGEHAMRLEIWRMSTRLAAYARHREMQAALEAQMQAQGQGYGLPYQGRGGHLI